MANILHEDKSLGLRKEGLGVVLDSELPHLIGKQLLGQFTDNT